MYSKEKERKYKNDPFNRNNFEKDEDGNYICPNNKKLTYVHDLKMRTNIYEAYNKVYRCNDCEGCPLREKCTTSKYGRMVWQPFLKQILYRELFIFFWC